MSTGWDHDAFREYVIGCARKARVARDQATLAALTGIDSGLLGRYFRGETQPGPKNLERIAATVPGTTMSQLMVLAGRASAGLLGLKEAAPPAPRPPHPLADEVDHLLGDRSPLDESERGLLTELLDRVLRTYRVGARRKAV